MPTREQLEQALRNADKAGDTEAATKLANALKTMSYEDANEQQQKADYKALLDEQASEVGPVDSFFINMGRGLTNVARGVGLAEPEDESIRYAMESLQDERPITGTLGEITGEALPFVVPGGMVGNIASLPARVAAGGAVGAGEGAILANAKDQNVVSGAITGLSIGAGFEALAPIVNSLGRQVVGKVTGKPPKGALLDAAGSPTSELQQALDASGISYDDLTQEAKKYVSAQPTGANPQQAARAADFQSNSIPASRGDITQNFQDQAVEQRLLQSAYDPVAEPFRQFKLRQSEAIKGRLQELAPSNPLPEETGELIKDALIGRKRLLRTQKNALYEQAAEAAEDVGGIPMFTDNIRAAVPDQDTIDDLAITAPQAAQSLQGILKRFGIIDPTPAEIEAGFQVVPLDMKTYERFRKSINAIERGDTTGAIKVATGPIKDALDNEAVELADTLAAQGFDDSVIEPLRQAREVVRQMKTEFSPQSITGRLVDTKKDGVTNIIEASNAYNKMVSRSMPVENVRKVVSSLKSAGEPGQQAMASMQATTIMDLVDAGFSTQSRKIDGINTFNPIAFRNRMDKIGRDKLEAIFANNPQTLKKLNNIEQIAKAVTPSADAVPKGSASVLQDVLNNLGIIGITSKIPGGGILVEALTKTAGNARTRREVAESMAPRVAVDDMRNLIEQTLPGIASAAGIAVSQQQEPSDQDL